MVRGWELFRWIDTCLAHLVRKFKNIFGMTERSAEGSKYKNCHISGITYSTRLGVVPMDRYLFGASHEKVKNIFGKTERDKIKEVSTNMVIFQV